jgi:uncharacterized protein YeaC (DUF1315 family)
LAKAITNGKWPKVLTSPQKKRSLDKVSHHESHQDNHILGIQNWQVFACQSQCLVSKNQKLKEADSNEVGIHCNERLLVSMLSVHLYFIL